jgi:Na+-transporting NADH:ubiquinone oxidoreductase subunit C
MAEESVARSLSTVLILALVCSALVAGAAVMLRPLQEANSRIDRKKNILRAAGLYRPGGDVEGQFAAVRTRIVDLASGAFVPEEQLSPNGFEQRKAALSSDLGRSLTPEQDLARLSRVEKYSLVYLVMGADGKVEQLILPIRGKGLWSTLFAYVALDADLTTIRGISFYAHGETPGLGGEIENETWQHGWHGKKIYGPDGAVALKVVKGKAEDLGEGAATAIDGLSGATMTGAGVSNLLRFWFGEHGFKPFLQRLRIEGGLNG